MNLARKLTAEGLGTAFLLAIVIGSGIMGERLASGNVAIALLANSLATGAGLMVLIAIFGPISGAHFNPVVSLAETMLGRLPARDLSLYVPVQIAGAFAGVAVANLMFDLPMFFASTKIRTGGGLWLGEFVATFGLLFTIWGFVKFRSSWVSAGVGAYIMAAYWFTSSTSFANPAVTLARAASDTFAGIAPNCVTGFIVAQLVGTMVAVLVGRWLFDLPVPESDDSAESKPENLTAQ